MKQFKFRAWRKDFNRMQFSDKVEVDADGSGWVPESKGDAIGVFFESAWGAPIMYCIEMKDKNGLDIYQSDWVRACFMDRKGFHYIQGVIVMDEFIWCVDTKDNLADERIYSINMLHDFEVLGNIHENPELLGALASDV